MTRKDYLYFLQLHYLGHTVKIKLKNYMMQPEAFIRKYDSKGKAIDYAELRFWKSNAVTYAPLDELEVVK